MESAKSIVLKLIPPKWLYQWKQTDLYWNVRVYSNYTGNRKKNKKATKELAEAKTGHQNLDFFPSYTIFEHFISLGFIVYCSLNVKGFAKYNVCALLPEVSRLWRTVNGSRWRHSPWPHTLSMPAVSLPWACRVGQRRAVCGGNTNKASGGWIQKFRDDEILGMTLLS